MIANDLVAPQPCAARARVAHAVRQYGTLSQTFIADALLETGRLGWDPWVVSKLPALNAEAFGYPPQEQILRPIRPGVLGRAAARMAGGDLRLRTTARYRAAIEQAGAQLMHVHFGWTAAEMSVSRLGVPTLISFHGSDVTAWPHASDANLAAYRAMFAEIGRATPVTVTSRFIEDRLRSLGFQGRVEMLAAGVRLDEFEFRITPAPSHDLRLLFVGRQVECKGLDVLLHALPRVLADWPSTSLDVIGEGSADAIARHADLVRTLGLERAVHFHGGLSRPDVLRAMRRAHLLVAPSRRSSTGEEEGSPVITKEALAAGLPVVGTLVGGLPETIPPDLRHQLVPSEDPPALARQILATASEREGREQRAIAGRRWIEANFDWKRLGQRLGRLYEELLFQHHAGDPDFFPTPAPHRLRRLR